MNPCISIAFAVVLLMISPQVNSLTPAQNLSVTGLKTLHTARELLYITLETETDPTSKWHAVLEGKYDELLYTCRRVPHYFLAQAANSSDKVMGIFNNTMSVLCQILYSNDESMCLLENVSSFLDEIKSRCMIVLLSRSDFWTTLEEELNGFGQSFLNLTMH